MAAIAEPDLDEPILGRGPRTFLDNGTEEG
jgi:hypothetical protein